MESEGVFSRLHSDAQRQPQTVRAPWFTGLNGTEVPANGIANVSMTDTLICCAPPSLQLYHINLRHAVQQTDQTLSYSLLWALHTAHIYLYQMAQAKTDFLLSCSYFLYNMKQRRNFALLLFQDSRSKIKTHDPTHLRRIWMIGHRCLSITRFITLYKSVKCVKYPFIEYCRICKSHVISLKRVSVCVPCLTQRNVSDLCACVLHLFEATR